MSSAPRRALRVSSISLANARGIGGFEPFFVPTGHSLARESAVGLNGFCFLDHGIEHIRFGVLGLVPPYDELICHPFLLQ